MIKALELALSTSCLNKAQADEPLFVLRAHDPLFSAIVRLWAAAAHGVHEVEKREEAYTLADEGSAWWRDHQPKADAQQAQGALIGRAGDVQQIKQRGGYGMPA